MPFDVACVTSSL